MKHLSHFQRIILLLALLPGLGAPAQEARNSVKMTLLSLGSGSTRLTYERHLAQRRSAELTVGLIGAGADILNHASPAGYLIKAAHKWTLLPQPSCPSPLAGLYLKPELIWADYSYHLPSAPLGPERHTHQLALLAEVGYQLILNHFAFDLYAGLGPTIGTGNEQNYYHGFMTYPVHSPLAWTAGFRLGAAF